MAFMMIGNVACETRIEAEKAIDSLVQEYAQKMHCGEAGCTTCDVGAAHDDGDEGKGLQTIDAAFNAGHRSAMESLRLLEGELERQEKMLADLKQKADQGGYPNIELEMEAKSAVIDGLRSDLRHLKGYEVVTIKNNDVVDQGTPVPEKE